jgi:hypothetical protein
MIYHLIRGLGWPFGLRFARDNQVVPIVRLGRLKRVRGPGFFWIIPFVEGTLKPISTAAHVEKFMFDKVVSQDNIPFDFRLTAIFEFRPELVAPTILARFVHLSETDLVTRLRSIVHDFTSEGLRALAVKFKAEELRNDKTRFIIKRNLIKYLSSNLRSLGLVPVKDVGIIIRAIDGDQRFERTMLDVEQHEAILQILSQYKDNPELIDDAVRTEMLACLANLKGNLTLLSPLEFDYFHGHRTTLQPTNNDRQRFHN